MAPSASRATGAAQRANCTYPEGVAVDGQAGNLYIADTGNYRIRKGIGPRHHHYHRWDGGYGFSGDTGPATMRRSVARGGLAVTAGASSISRTPAIIGSARSKAESSPRSPATEVRFFRRQRSGSQRSTKFVSGIAVDTNGDVFFGDWATSGAQGGPAIITTVAGNTTRRLFSGDGGPAISAQVGSCQFARLDGTGICLCRRQFQWAACA